MNYSNRRYSWILFLLGFIMTQCFINSVMIYRLMHEIKNFEPVIIEQQVIKEVIAEEPVEVSKVVEVAEVVEEIKPYIDCPLDDDIQQMIFEKCEEYDVDFAFAMAVMFCESSFRPDIISYDGSSVGLMQINKINHEWLSETLGVTDFFDPEDNVTAGLYMLSNLFDKYEDPAKVLMAYNLGEAGARRIWDQGIYTSNYAEKVLDKAHEYRKEIEMGNENV